MFLRLTALGLLFAVAAFLLDATASAQTTPSSITLVKNTGQTDNSSTLGIGSTDRAQGFTTGASADGYRLTSVKLDLNLSNAGGDQPTYVVRIHTESGGNPTTTTVGGALTGGALASGSNTFTAPGDGIDLSASTKYYVVFRVTSSGSIGASWRATDSDAEDAGAAAGWSVFNASVEKGQSATNWTANSNRLQIELNGYTKKLLVENLGQGNHNIACATQQNDCAQAFTTGPSTYGWQLTGLDLRMRANGSSVPGYTAGIYAGSSNAPDLSNKAGSLTNPSSLPPITTTAGARVRFAISAGGIYLAANTRYWLVLDSVGGGQGATVWQASSTDEDGGAQAGWSIADSSVSRAATSSGGWQVATEGGNALKLALRGQPRTTPPPSNTPSQPGSDSGATPPTPANMAYGPVQWHRDADADAGMQAFPTVMGEISSNRSRNGSGSFDLSNIAASLAPERERRSRGYYLSTRVYGVAEQPALVQRAPGGASYIVGADETRHRVVRGSPLVLVKLWHVYRRADTGINGIERLGGPWHPRSDHLLAEPVEVCLRAPDVEAAIAVRIGGDSAWTVLESEEREGRLCAETVRVGWVIVVEAP